MATANPNFNTQFEALKSLNNVYKMCVAVQFLQVFAAIGFGLFWWNFVHDPAEGVTLHNTHAYLKYGSLLYFCATIFAHVVVAYVFISLSKLAAEILMNSPVALDSLPVIQSNRLAKGSIPVFAGHLILVGAIVALVTAQKENHSQFSGFLSTTFSLGFAALIQTYIFSKKSSSLLRNFLNSANIRFKI